MELKIQFTDVTPLCDKELFEQYFSQMPPYRKEKILRYKFDKDKRLSLGVGILLKRAMDVAGIPSDTGILYNEYEKPFLVDYPGFHFNLSHSGKYVMCSVCGEENGCDVEKTDTVTDNLAHRVLTPSEYDYFNALPNDNAKSEYYYRLRTLKESYMKATGKGLSLMPAEISIELNPKPVLVSSSLQKECRFFEFGFASDYKCAACVLGNNDVLVSTEIVDLSMI